MSIHPPNGSVRRPAVGEALPPAATPGLPAVTATFLDPRGWEVAVLDDRWACDAATAHWLVDQITQPLTATTAAPTAPAAHLSMLPGEVQGS